MVLHPADLHPLHPVDMFLHSADLPSPGPSLEPRFYSLSYFPSDELSARCTLRIMRRGSQLQRVHSLATLADTHDKEVLCPK